MSGFELPKPIVENEAENMRKFAELSLKGMQPIHIAETLFPDKSDQYQMNVASAWGQSKAIESIKQSILLTKGDGPFLPKKEAIVKEILAMTKEGSTSSKLAAYKLAAELMGWVSKGGANVNVSVTNRVIKVPLIVDKEQFEADTIAEQARMIADAKALH